ncbi:hypothetical protein GCM10010862_05710 [Devosia nitrariae]|uniref:Uncharacterized protein n=1 Tax=Devosia nitrariae TaxID=2071872 RepID=A0ABQ5W0H7_9HYPH|nr:hypothetical protein GCM10010862_05710 [Devosia nitrariae]
MRWCNEKSSTQQIELLALAIVLAKHPSGGGPTFVSTDWRSATTVVQNMRCTVWQQNDISTQQLLRCSRLRILDNGSALDYHVVGNLVLRSLAPGNSPRGTVGAAELELTRNGDDLEEMA